MEEAVSMLVEHLVRPVLPSSAVVTPEMEQDVARQFNDGMLNALFYLLVFSSFLVLLKYI
ncbi:hypothetical protein BRADI_2g35628v3 [Brachypodium distachyon]|uniref:Uncharacterized protein n=1 Tax=Brachypodium distachyon TaxID=15368 RepID=A0A2K2DBZ3_BRADI|nr:hypothetical protein BRADI_2g35628v3 [Brachypodium distachyon]